MNFIIEHVSRNFDKKEVLRDINFTFKEGRIYGLLGRNGAGKTTLFNCINKDIKVDTGNFYLESTEKEEARCRTTLAMCCPRQPFRNF